MKTKSQETRNQLKIKVSTFLIILLGTTSVMAQDYSVTPLSDFLEIYKEKNRFLSEEIEENESITFSEKLAFYESKINKMKDDFRNSRKSEYLAKRVKRARRLTCKGTRIRGVTDCESVSIDAPTKNMYTLKDWVKVEGESKYVKVLIDSSFVRLSVSSTGMNTNKGAVYTTFKYRPDLVPSIVDKEAIELFSQIIVDKKE